LKISLFFIAMLCWNINSQSQDCGMPETPPPVTNTSSFAPTCINQSTALNNSILFLPTINSKKLKVKVNYIFWTNPNIAGGGNFDPITHAVLIDDLIGEVNRRMANLVFPTSTDPNCAVSPFIMDSKIEYVVNKVWIEDDYAWNLENGKISNSSWWLCPSSLSPTYDNYIHQKLEDENVPDGINVYFGMEGSAYETIITNGNIGTATTVDCSQWPSYSDFDKISDVQMINEFITFSAGDFLLIIGY
jgi:hypothetical protein